MKLKSIIVFIILLLGINIHSVSADNIEQADALKIGPYIGFSKFSGVIGLELQKGHMGFSLGLPGNLGLKYYLSENGDRWFVGAYGQYMSFDDKKTIDTIQYKDVNSVEAGLGFGYKWRWKNKINLSASFAIGYEEEERTGDFATRTEKNLWISPGLVLGYLF